MVIRFLGTAKAKDGQHPWSLEDILKKVQYLYTVKRNLYRHTIWNKSDACAFTAQ